MTNFGCFAIRRAPGVLRFEENGSAVAKNNEAIDQHARVPANMNDRSLTYAGSGVDIDRGEELVTRIKSIVGQDRRPGLLTGIGGFGALISLKEALPAFAQMKDPVLVSGTDGVGTKLKLAFATGNHQTIGIDLVAMCVNDILTLGAKPLFFLDYFATGRLDVETAAQVVQGIADGCRIAKMNLVGGETAELPGFYADGEYDLAGFAVGVVDREDIVDGANVCPGDQVIGLASSGLHSNGYSLARKALLERQAYSLSSSTSFDPSRTWAEVLLEPTKIYNESLDSLAKAGITAKAIAHITGGGLTLNLPRVLKPGLVAKLHRSNMPPAPLFEAIQVAGAIADKEMLQTFNMGVGLACIVRQDEISRSVSVLSEAGEKAFHLGEIVAGADPEKEASVVFA